MTRSTPAEIQSEPLRLKPKQVQEAKKHLLECLADLNMDHPYLLEESKSYAWFIEEIRSTNPNDTGDTGTNAVDRLGGCFDEIRRILHDISDKRNRNIGPNEQHLRLIPSKYLPLSFDLLLVKAHDHGNVAEHVVNGLADTTETVVLGETRLDEVTSNYRSKVKGMVLSALVYDYGKASEIREALSSFGEDNIFTLLTRKDETLKRIRKRQGRERLPRENVEEVEPLEAAIALIVLRTRAQLTHGNPKIPKIKPAVVKIDESIDA